MIYQEEWEKTFLTHFILTKVRRDADVAIALSGIAQTLMLGSGTANSRFNIAIKVNESALCKIKKNISNIAHILQHMRYIDWDENSIIRS